MGVIIIDKGQGYRIIPVNPLVEQVLVEPLSFLRFDING